MDSAYELQRNSPLRTCEELLLSMRLIRNQPNYHRLLVMQHYRHDVAIVFLFGLIREIQRAELTSFATSTQQRIARNESTIMVNQTLLTALLNGTCVGPLSAATVTADTERLLGENERLATQRRERLAALARTELEGQAAEIAVQQRWES
nr:hypothetical protein CFP56_04018 [Quercus suber]